MMKTLNANDPSTQGHSSGRKRAMTRLAMAGVAVFAFLAVLSAGADEPDKPFNRWAYILRKGIETARREPKAIVTFLEAESLPFTCSEGGKAEMVENEKTSGGKYLRFPFTAPGQFVEFEVDVPEPAEYTVIAGSWNTPANGIYRLSLDGEPLGPERNQCYTRKAPEPCWHWNNEIETIGNVRFETAGKKKLRFTVTDKLYFSRGYELTFDFIKLKKFAPAAPDVRALVPVADAYVDSGNPLEFVRRANYGGGTRLKVGYGKTAFLKFDLSEVKDIRKATLEMTVLGHVGGQPFDLSVKAVDGNSWDEHRINASSAPTPGATFAKLTVPVLPVDPHNINLPSTPGTVPPSRVDVTDYIKSQTGKPFVSLAIAWEGAARPPETRIASRDHAPKLGVFCDIGQVGVPRLIVEGDVGEPEPFRVHRMVERKKVTPPDDPGKLVFDSASYQVFERMIRDKDGKDWAFTDQGATFVSSPRAGNHSQPQLNGDDPLVFGQEGWLDPGYQSKYPKVETGIPIADAAYKVALKVFERCRGGLFTFDTTEGVWQAGACALNGRWRFGYGAWIRDSVLSGYSLVCLDPRGHQMSIASVGIDNGSDAEPFLLDGMLNQYHWTGDRSLLDAKWKLLSSRVNAILDGKAGHIQWDPEKGLMKTGHSVIDDFPPALNTNVFGEYPASVSMYWAWMLGEMARLGPEMGEAPETVARWREIEKILRGNADRFWSEKDGIYFAGLPGVGNSHVNKVVETNVVSLASHPRFGFYDTERFRRMMAYRAREPKWFNEFGYQFETCKGQSGHWTGPIMMGIPVGYAINDMRRDIEAYFFACVRHGTYCKDFTEFISFADGLRASGGDQLWTAATIPYMIFRVLLGMDWDESGISFANACVPESLSKLKVTGLKYRNAVLNIEVSGFGKLSELRLDGRKVERVPAGIAPGTHEVELVMTDKQALRIRRGTNRNTGNH